MKKHLNVILYFTLSLYAVLNCEFITSIQAASLLGASQDNILYAVYSIMVALGVLLFYLFKRNMKKNIQIKTAITVAAVIAGVCLITLAFISDTRIFWIALVLLYLSVGFNTGVASLMLYSVYRKKEPAGKILALASLIGFALHYMMSLAFSSAMFNLLAAMLATLPAIVLLPVLLYTKSPDQGMDMGAHSPANHNQNEERNRMSAMLGIVSITIIILSFLIGVADSLVAVRMPFHFGPGFFFYPMLFHAPGQVLACLLVDVKQGRYISVAAMISAILLIPTTLFLESPEEFYMNSIFSYFIGGFFMVYIMTGFISIAHKAENRLLVICLSGMLYPAFCGVGGILSTHISFSMDNYMVLVGYSILIVFLAIAVWMTQSHGVTKTVTIVTEPVRAVAELNQDGFAEQFHLTEREKEILPYLLSSMTTEEISAELHISVNTLKTHTRNILRKTDHSSRRDLRKQLFQ